jgi:hypothetical protein
MPTVSDWIDDVRAEWVRGVRRPLTQQQHAAVNARYPGLTARRCPICGTAIDDAQTYCSDECEEDDHADD